MNKPRMREPLVMVGPRMMGHETRMMNQPRIQDDNLRRDISREGIKESQRTEGK